MGIEEKIIELIRENVPDLPEEIKTTDSFLTDLGFDSLEIYQVIAVVEDEFRCVISDEALETFQTLQDLIDFVETAVEKG